MDTTKLVAADLMTRDVVTGNLEESLRVAAWRMNTRRIHCLLVALGDDRFGMIAAKDIVQLLGDVDESVLDELTIKDAMTSPVFTIQEHQPIADCINLMRMVGVRRMPVLAGRQLVGMLSSTDVLRSLGTGAANVGREG